MDTTFILQGKVLWSFDYEIAAYASSDKFINGVSSVGPLHNHTGDIALSAKNILIENIDDDCLNISLSSIVEIYMGCDEVYTSTSIKNLGLLWQPLRIKFDNQCLYLIIDYNGLYTHNKRWHEELMSLLQ